MKNELGLLYSDEKVIWEKRVKTATPVFSLDNYSQAELESMPINTNKSNINTNIIKTILFIYKTSNKTRILFILKSN